MKPFLLIFFFLLFCKIANAQFENPPKLSVTADAGGPPVTIRICAPSRSSILTKPLVLIYTHNQTIRINIGIDSIDKIEPKSIKSINVLKDAKATSMYGDAAKAGVVQIYLDDEKYPDAYKRFIKPDTTVRKN
ncbi:hypothetical protein KXQ82_17585 [Mucilaginibacter sp. HMF5004]|uniref:hypothetical protein n=1 Tax=Mucilaginibacter rivuli TaxID=2857527 RepID=UPI001C5EA27E|nr:hypothetical protein [Mucilaginibacter rivuli]MBW4891544.1 hypothetical protein [Mucilaginibacter rivuli]